jgi:hypothetical protein
MFCVDKLRFAVWSATSGIALALTLKAFESLTTVEDPLTYCQPMPAEWAEDPLRGARRPKRVENLSIQQLENLEESTARWNLRWYYEQDRMLPDKECPPWPESLGDTWVKRLSAYKLLSNTYEEEVRREIRSRQQSGRHANNLPNRDIESLIVSPEG